jgi:hypothetical protein
MEGRRGKERTGKREKGAKGRKRDSEEGEKGRRERKRGVTQGTDDLV